jgi:F420-0:gamma-glutamyl ligase-like protein
MTAYYALALRTSYWMPGEDYISKIVGSIEAKIETGDFLVVSEKALSIAMGNIVDESNVKPSFTAKVLARFWMKKVWSYPLGILSNFGQRLLSRLRNYPFESGSRHKQVSLEQAGFMQALMFGSEGGIDGSNLAYSYVSLPIKNAQEIALKIRREISDRLKSEVCVIIADTDKTYKWHNFFLTPRPSPMKGIQSFGGVITYVLGRMLRLKRSSTPLATADRNLSAAEALTITNIADKARGPGSGATVWDMAARFQVDINNVSWEMLSKITHKPLVIVRRKTVTVNR